MSSSVADDAATNSYEKQLYTVFKTFDVDNAEALDRAAVYALCDSLQLEDRGAALLDTLFERRSDRVTFTQFRNGLLAVLGADTATSTEQVTNSEPIPSDRPPSDEESSGCEAAPRFVFGTKKYGRRSRPQRVNDTASAPRSSSASRLDSDECRACSRLQLGRSASTADARALNEESCPPRLDPARRIDRAGALALCRSLSMDGVEGLIERIFEDSPNTEPTVGEFFGRLNAALATTIEEAREPTLSDVSVVLDGLDNETAAGVPVDVIVETWEHSGVPRPRALLLELGFDGPALRLSDLERALDEELRVLPTPGRERSLLIVAALSASRLRARLAQALADATAAERDKLRADVNEANTRARLLAQEVDENNARIESELKASLRRAETRHAEAMRAAAAEASAERERAAAADLRLQTETSRHAEIEARLRTEASELRTRVSEAESRAVAVEEQLIVLGRERARLAVEVAVGHREDTTMAEGVGRARGELAEKLDVLRRENEVLRDRNDELVAELEARARHPSSGAKMEMSGGDLSTELANLLPSCQAEVSYAHAKVECDSSPVSLEQLSSEAEGTPSGETECDSCYVHRHTDLSKPVLGIDCSTQTECLADLENNLNLQQQLEDAQRTHEEDRSRLEALVKELEMGLEQMKSEYERCEEYWARKLEEERSLHAEELRGGDERLAELVARVRDYETQFARSLPTIDEKYSLELQVTDLEEEFSRYRRDKEQQLADRERDLRRLADRVAALEGAGAGVGAAGRGGGGGGAGATREGRGGGGGAGAEVRELRVRTARAEAAVRRLHARLAAADLLVKDLYVENCHLAHRNHI